MTDPDPDPIVLDSSFLLAYDRVRTPGGVLGAAQSAAATWLVDGVPLIVPVLSLLVAFRDAFGRLPEVEFLLDGDPQLVVTVPVTRSAVADLTVGLEKHFPGGPYNAEVDAWEIEHVLWCATGRDLDGAFTPWPVATYAPDRYAGRGVPLIVL